MALTAFAIMAVVSTTPPCARVRFKYIRALAPWPYMRDRVLIFLVVLSSALTVFGAVLWKEDSVDCKDRITWCGDNFKAMGIGFFAAGALGLLSMSIMVCMTWRSINQRRFPRRSGIRRASKSPNPRSRV